MLNFRATFRELRKRAFMNDLMVMEGKIDEARQILHSDLEVYKSWYEKSHSSVIPNIFLESDGQRVIVLMDMSRKLEKCAKRIGVENLIVEYNYKINKFHNDAVAAFELINSEQPDYNGALAIV